MTPYYSDAYTTIYHGDCREILPQLPPVDILLTDPPYPKLKGGQSLEKLGGVAKRYRPSTTVGEPWGNDIEGVRIAAGIATKGVFCFCSFQSLDLVPPLMRGRRVALITWYKRNSAPSVQNAPHFQTEFVWVFANEAGLEWRKLKTLYDIPQLQAGCMATERVTDDNGKSLHPTQKPIALCHALLSVGGASLIDPFMGSGTTLRAAKDLQRKAIGIEIEERYCEIAAKRLAQEVLPLASNPPPLTKEEAI